MNMDFKQAPESSVDNVMTYRKLLFNFKLYHVKDGKFNSPENTHLVIENIFYSSSLNVKMRPGSHCAHTP